MTVNEVAAALGRSQLTVWKMLQRGELEGRKAAHTQRGKGAKWDISPASVQAALARQETPRAVRKYRNKATGPDDMIDCLDCGFGVTSCDGCENAM